MKIVDGNKTLRAMLPGLRSPSNGHVNMIERAARLFDSVVVVVADNVLKNACSTADERISMLRQSLAEHTNVEVALWNGLIVDFDRQHVVAVMTGGARLGGFRYEFDTHDQQAIGSGARGVVHAYRPEIFCFALVCHQGDGGHLAPMSACVS
jgi:pantetheine-phosphate adenylyltransferase